MGSEGVFSTDCVSGFLLNYYPTFKHDYFKKRNNAKRLIIIINYISLDKLLKKYCVNVSGFLKMTENFATNLSESKNSVFKKCKRYC